MNRFRMHEFIRTSLASLFTIILMSAPSLGQDNSICAECHEVEKAEVTNGVDKGDDYEHSLGSLGSSVHAELDCIDCHADLADSEEFPHAESLGKVQCGECHSDVTEIYENSWHSKSGNKKSPNCSSCHGTHGILGMSDSLSTVSNLNLAKTCSKCHEKVDIKIDPMVRVGDSFGRYMEGIHAKGIKAGLGSAASCVDCHSSHDLRKVTDPLSPVFHSQVPKTCAKCHNDIYIQYSRGIHGKALAAGVSDAPNCTDCHGEHLILRPDNPESPINQSNIAEFVCGKCHNDPKFNKEFDMDKGRFTSYQDSYHGLAVKGGSIKAADCTSCHTAHEILPASNPASSVHPNNLTETCGQCHPKSNAEFAASYSHEIEGTDTFLLSRIVRIIYIVLIILVVGAMVLHNLLILIRYLINKYRSEKTTETLDRLSGNFLFQHIVLTISFMLLACTGFALKYPDLWWVGIFNSMGPNEEFRGLLHRMSAILLLYISVHHMLYVLFTKYGKTRLRAMIPVWKDWSDIKLNMKYQLGLVAERPKYACFDYTQKLEYWALVWGTIIMAGTGFVLWFPTFFTKFAPVWIIQVSQTVHFYEAILATLAIIVFHFFFVLLHPAEYPMSFVWITGKMTAKEAKIHHTQWYEEELTSRKSDESDKKKTTMPD